MSNISRVCPRCGKQVALEARFCSSCGYDSQTGNVAGDQELPVPLGKAALPVIAGVAGLALRVGWKILQSPAAQDAARSLVHRLVASKINPPSKAEESSIVRVENEKPAPRSNASISRNQPRIGKRRTIRIRTTWATGDARGVWRHGTTDQTIEIDE